jgi:proline iminopeptidase
MQIEVNGTRLWFDVDGPAVVPDGAGTRERRSIVLVHGGPGSYDHSYFKPHFSRLTDVAQVVYLDLRDHGRSARNDTAAWTYEQCADDIRAFCDAIGLDGPIVYGHSMGGWVVLMYGARHPGHAEGLIANCTMARFDLDRLTEGFRSAAGDEVAALARRCYAGGSVTDQEWDRVYAAFGPKIPSPDELARRIGNPEVGEVGAEQFLRLDVLDQLPRITSRTLVLAAELDAVTPVAAAREILEAMAPGIGQLEVMPGAGHFPWLDAPDRFFELIRDFATSNAG